MAAQYVPAVISVGALITLVVILLLRNTRSRLRSPRRLATRRYRKPEQQIREMLAFLQQLHDDPQRSPLSDTVRGTIVVELSQPIDKKSLYERRRQLGVLLRRILDSHGRPYALEDRHYKWLTDYMRANPDIFRQE